MSDPKDFTHFGLDPLILSAITEMGYATPTPIQAKAIPVVMKGLDVMGAAQTGTGKTAGFALPIIQKLLPHASASMSPARHPVRALILAPTRELADQTADNVKKYIAKTPLRCALVYGGVDMDPQTTALRSGVEILVATPGRSARPSAAKEHEPVAGADRRARRSRSHARYGVLAGYLAHPEFASEATSKSDVFGDVLGRDQEACGQFFA